MQHVLTLVAPKGALSKHLVSAVRAALQDLGATVGGPDWLSPEEAADIPFDGLAPEQADAAARRALEGAAVDAIAQPAEGRRKKLLLADMDSTIVTTETLDELAAFAGVKERVAPITERAMRGELDFRQALAERVALLAGLPVSALERTWDATEMMLGAAELVATMSAHGARCVLVSGGFTFFTERVATRLGFHAHQSNTLLIDGGKLTGRVAEPILDRDAKLAALKRDAAERGLPLSATLAVGDGANDLDMLNAAGLGIAFNAKPFVREQAHTALNQPYLDAVLQVLGFTRDEVLDAVP